MIDILGNTLTFLLALGVIIFVHELGHLLVAKYFDVRVVTFSLGFGKRLWGFRRGETDYRVALVPLGGYVQMGGEDPSVESDDPRDFVNKPRWQRILVFIGGPFMNVVLSVLLIAVVYMIGVNVAVPPDGRPIVGSVAADSAGERAGLQSGDRVVTVNGKALKRWEDLQFVFLTSPETEVALEVERAGQTVALSVVPGKVPKYGHGDAGVYPRSLPVIGRVLAARPAEAAGLQADDVLRRVDDRPLTSRDDFISYVSERPGQAIELEVARAGETLELTVTPMDDGGRGLIGVEVTQGTYLQRYPPLEALRESVRFNVDLAQKTFYVLGRLVTGRLGVKGTLSGPIEIAAISGAAARTGVAPLVHLIGVISISIGILNLLPIPVLDGGQIVILLVESLRRRDLSMRLKERINQVGFVMIVALMVMVLYFDLVKNIPAGLLPGS